MLDLIKIVREELLSDINITDIVDDRIYMPFSPSGNIAVHYPMITIQANEGITDSLTNDYRISLMIHIWTKDDERVTLGKKIAKQVLLNIDRDSFLSNNPRIYQIWKTNAIESFEDDEQVYHKTLIFDVIMEGYGGFKHPCD